MGGAKLPKGARLKAARSFSSEFLSDVKSLPNSTSVLLWHHFKSEERGSPGFSSSSCRSGTVMAGGWSRLPMGPKTGGGRNFVLLSHGGLNRSTIRAHDWWRWPCSWDALGSR